ncbi:multimeric flavodoxin WrbA [Rheinheimera pacifica]|uniref:flavodoxin family protein n=1 Tax=Rheinheimera pacifica TaxID=173990 RepID=UPI002168161A|nr:flavodoxin family protein [Rheinheimera pacifica]MCS4308525.1 multimeric flavodoxin WrbA [Rheinheimera pacifica]
MITVAVVFYSASGSTRQLAAAVAGGAATVPGVNVMQSEIASTDISAGRFCNSKLLEELTSADAIIFGSPTYMGSVSAQFKAFADASSECWEPQLWANKIAAGFTIGTNFSGDQLHTLQYLQILANQQGMLWVGLDNPGNQKGSELNRLGAQSGLIAHSADGLLDETDLLTAHYLGQRVAQLSKKFVG